MKMKIEREIIDCLNRNSLPGEKFGDNLLTIIQRTDTDNVTIPVLGTQGMGKSTLINALLKENILPNDADETTCVPVEVSYSEDEYGEVYFLDGKPPVKANTIEELQKYVDNNENPANRLRVDRIKLYRKAEILKNGLTIVDLPGVGSVTLENEQTTKRYIEKQCVAIFVIPTVPTIRGTEGMFIQGAWSQFAGAMFVQNEWGETKKEIEDSVDHNTKVLRQISEKIGSKFEGPIEVVNALKALKGEINHDDALIEKSNIRSLDKRIKEYFQHWEENISASLKDRSQEIIKLSLQLIEKRLKEIEMGVNEAKEAKRKAYQAFRDGNEEIFQIILKIKKWLREKEIESTRKIREKAAKTAGDIRADMHKIINEGVYDGENLTNAFNDVQSEYGERFFDEVVNYLRKINYEFESQMEGLAEKIEIQNDLQFDKVSHNTKEKLKWEKSLDVIGGIGGGIAGVAFAAPLAAALLSNPAGWVVLGVGLAITAVCTAIASLFKKGVKAKRAAEARQKIDPKIEEVEVRLYEVTCKKNKEFFDGATQVLNNIKKNLQEREDQMYAEIDKNDLKGEDKEMLIRDKDLLTSYLSKI